ncbi:MAG: formate/nitrite transporter family protein [Oscillospiraceae bacterium]|nr:formate/nitrite transporter family protein [Oscillospiraceae bacterium]
MSKSPDMLMQIADININSEIKKSNLPILKMILLGIMAGAFIALGGDASNVASFGVENAGLQRVVAGCLFPVGLMMVVFSGSELFTGNCLMIMGALDKKVKSRKILINLFVVFFSNLLGALTVDFLIFYSGQLDIGSGAVGAYAIKIAVAKTTISPLKAFTSGILCNIFVCMAILMSSIAKEVVGKIFAIFFPIFAFVVCGFEHSIANMFYIPMGILSATNPQYTQMANNLYGVTLQQSNNLLSLNGIDSIIYVTLGNIVGGMLFVGIPFYLAHRKVWNK